MNAPVRMVIKMNSPLILTNLADDVKLAAQNTVIIEEHVATVMEFQCASKFCLLLLLRMWEYNLINFTDPK